MNIIQKLRAEAIYGRESHPVALEVADLLEEIKSYLIAAADGSMSRNNSEQLAAELLDKINFKE